MKKTKIIIVALSLSSFEFGTWGFGLGVSCFAQNIGINTTGNPPKDAALLEVGEGAPDTKGLLIPRVNLTDVAVYAPLTGTPVTSLLVYNTATAGVSPTNVVPGYYYWDGTKWISITGGNGGNTWSITGNAGTTVGTNFLGTTDAQDFAIYTNNAERMRITSSGTVGIGATPSTTERLRVQLASGIGATIGTTPNDGSVALFINPATATQQGLIVRGKAGQTGALLTVQSSTPTALFSVQPNGNVGIGTVNPREDLEINKGHLFHQSGWIIQYFNAYFESPDTKFAGYNGGSKYAGTIQFDPVNGLLYFRVSTAAGTDGSVLTWASPMVMNSAGNVGINTGAPTALLSVNGTADKPGGGSWAVFSDERLKKDVRPFTDGLNVLEKINPVSFRYNGKAGIALQDTIVGVIAQEMKKIAPYAVKTVKMKLDTSDAEFTDILEFDPNALWYIMINAIKQQQEIINEQQAAITNHQHEIEKIKSYLGIKTKK